MYKTLLVTLTASALSTRAVASAPRKEPLDAATLSAIKSKFGRRMELANKHDFKALHGMFWQSPSTVLMAKSAIPSEGNWVGFWGNQAVDQKLHDIGGSGPVVREPDYSKLKVVGLTRDVAESYLPMNITVFFNTPTCHGDAPSCHRRGMRSGEQRCLPAPPSSKQIPIPSMVALAPKSKNSVGR
jgi:hypothetical protein